MVWAETAPAHRTSRLLDAGELHRLGALRSPTEADRYASAHTLLRCVVAEHTGTNPAALRFTATCRTCGGGHGTPRLRGAPALALSLSHAGSRVVVALGGPAPVGVDVEAEAATGFDGFERVALGPGERADTPAQRARTWVRKEALLKATGRGLTVEPSAVVLSALDAEPELLRWTAHEPPGPVHLRDVDVGPDHAACLAVLTAAAPTVSVHQHRW